MRLSQTRIQKYIFVKKPFYYFARKTSITYLTLPFIMLEQFGNTNQRFSNVEKSVQDMGNTLDHILTQLQTFNISSQNTEEKIQFEEETLGEAAKAFSQMNAKLRIEEDETKKINTPIEAAERANADVISEVLQDETQLTERFNRYDAKFEELTAAIAAQNTSTPNGKISTNTDKFGKLLAIKRNLPTIIIEAGDIRLSRTSKHYHEVSLKFPPEF